MGALSELYLERPGQAVSVDLTTLRVDAVRLRSLPWERVFAERDQLEAGAIANPDEGRQVGHYWLRSAQLAPTIAQATAIGDAVESVRDFVRDVRSGAVCAPDGTPFTDVLHIGIGGSALGPGLLVDALGTSDGLAVHLLDNTDPDGVYRILDALGERLRSSLLVVVSKSGSTPEPNNALAIVQSKLTERGLPVAGVCVAITVAESKLDRRAQSEGWLARFPLWDWVGGRTSATSVAGLLPCGLAGGDIAGLLAGAAQMDAWTRNNDPLHNPAAMLAGAWYATGKGHGERACAVIPYADRLTLLARHLQQLVMESIGQALDLDGNEVHQGLTVYGNKGSTDQHAYVQQLRDGRDDFFVTFVQVLGIGRHADVEVEPGINTGDYLHGFFLGTRRALVEAGRPCLTLTVDEVNAHTVGALVALFERAVSFYGSLVRINPYHQPGVEAGKRAAREALDLSQRARAALAQESLTVASLARSLNADALELYFLLRRLEATGRVTSVDNGRETLWSTP